jgi:DNA-binding Lrp family transcriptional regulator
MTETDRLELFGEKYAVEILTATSEPKTAMELSDQLDIPIATCYRRINQLQEHNLLEETGMTLSDRHQQSRQFRRTIEGIALEFADSLTVCYEGDSQGKQRGSPEL